MSKWFLIAFFAITRSTVAMDAETWPKESVHWGPQYPEVEPEESPHLTLEELMENSNDFPVDFPENYTRCVNLVNHVDRGKLQKKITEAYPVVQEQALRLFFDFLYQKRRFGNAAERHLYANTTLTQLVDRLLTKRAIAFFGVEDNYLLMDKHRGKGGWESVGTEKETPPLILANCLSYDEIKLSALLSVSSSSYFFNSQGQVIGEGVTVGAVGARLEKEKVMEYREVMKTKEQNTHLYGYGQFFVPTMQGVFTNFYGDVSATYDELIMRNAFDNEDRYLKTGDDRYFDKWVYSRRMALTIDCLLFESNDRGKKQEKNAELYVATLGLDSWRVTPEQDQLFLDTFLKRIEFLGKYLSHISSVYFYPMGACLPGNKIPIDGHPNGGITVQVRDWAIDSVQGSDEGKLIVVSYDWNGNALPGNQYWLHTFQAHDPAKLSQIAEIHNPHINTNIRGSNLRVVTLNGLLTLRDYIQSIKKISEK